MGPSSGNKYILTIVDGFSKWAVAVPLPNKKANTVAGALYRHLFTKLPFPTRIHSDLGKEFVNKTLEKVYGFLGPGQSNTTAYHPQGNAYAERIHLFFKYAISAYVNNDQTNWDQYFDTLMMCYNDTVHNATGVSPSEVIFGRKIGVPNLDHIEAPKKSTSNDPWPQRTFAERLKTILYTTRELIFDGIDKKKDRNTLSNLTVSLTSFNKDDKVRLRTPQKSVDKSKKLIPAWSGPYTIIDK